LVKSSVVNEYTLKCVQRGDRFVLLAAEYRCTYLARSDALPTHKGYVRVETDHGIVHLHGNTPINRQ